MTHEVIYLNNMLYTIYNMRYSSCISKYRPTIDSCNPFIFMNIHTNEAYIQNMQRKKYNLQPLQILCIFTTIFEKDPKLYISRITFSTAEQSAEKMSRKLWPSLASPKKTRLWFFRVEVLMESSRDTSFASGVHTTIPRVVFVLLFDRGKYMYFRGLFTHDHFMSKAHQLFQASNSAFK